jgi:hypothetical protein
MNLSPRRTCVTLGLLGVLLAAALAADVNARRNGIIIPARIAATMYLQGGPDAAASDTGDDDSALECAQHDRDCRSRAKEFVLARNDERALQESKDRAAASDDTTAKEVAR